MNASIARPAPSRLPRSARRCIVAASALMAAAGLLAVALLPPGSTAATLVKLLIVFAVVAALAWVVTRSTVWFLSSAPDAALDERERRIRERAYVRAYGVFVGLAALAAFYLLDLGPDLGLWVPADYNDWWAIVWAFVLLALGLPAALVAWDLPDPVPEHEI